MDDYGIVILVNLNVFIDSQVLTVVGRYVDLVDGTSFIVDKIHDHDSQDGMSFSTPRVGEDKEEPPIDKAMHRRQFRIGVNLFNW